MLFSISCSHPQGSDQHHIYSACGMWNKNLFLCYLCRSLSREVSKASAGVVWIRWVLSLHHLTWLVLSRKPRAEIHFFMICSRNKPLNLRLAQSLVFYRLFAWRSFWGADRWELNPPGAERLLAAAGRRPHSRPTFTNNPVWFYFCCVERVCVLLFHTHVHTNTDGQMDAQVNRWGKVSTCSSVQDLLQLTANPNRSKRRWKHFL